MAVLEVISPSKRQRTIPGDEPRKKVKRSPNVHLSHESATTSDIFELQVDELLVNLETEVNANIQKVTEPLKQLKTAIEDISPRKPLAPREAEASLRSTAKISTPFAVPPPKDAQYTLEYARPTAINVIGETASKTLLSRNGHIVADLVVVMPERLFQEKDYRDYRYFHKKSYYTACIAAGLQDANLPGLSYTFSVQNGNLLQPVLLAKQSTGDDDKMSTAVRIICVPPDDRFPRNKLYPWAKTFSPDSDTSANEQATSAGDHFYNSTLRSETTTLAYLGLIHKTSQAMPAFRKASLLFAVWLHQRGFGADLFQGGFGVFEAQALMAILLHNNPSTGEMATFRTRYNHHQLFKATLNFLSGRNFVEQPTLYSFSVDDSKRDVASRSLQQAKRTILNNESALFFDGIRAHNIFFKISPWSYNRLQRQADITIKCLSGHDLHRFENCFISKLDNTVTRYDQVIKLTVSNLRDVARVGATAVNHALDASNRLYRTVEKALGDRALELSFVYHAVGDWPVSADRPKPRKQLQLNIVVDARKATRLQDSGPSADEREAAAAFRRFWGSKAELRRFRDGSIQETIVWDNGKSESIVTQIVRYALERHHGDGDAISIDDVGDSFWNEIPQPIQSRTLTIFESMLQSFQKLEDTIRDLKMPLAIRQISPAAPGLRYSLLDIDKKPFAQTIPVVVQFESSSQWPDDLGAIQQVKIAFLQKLGDLLSQHESSIRTRVGLNQQGQRMFCRPFLEIMAYDFCFSVTIYHDRELFLLKSSPVDKLEERKSIVPEIQYHNTVSLRAPAHTSRIRDLCTKYPLLSQSMRLFKAWCSAHLLMPHFPEELLELLVVHVFTGTGPYGVPSSLRTAFLRVISMLANWDWHNEPLFVHLSDETDDQLIGQLNTHFEAWRKIDPTYSKMALIVGSTIDPTGTVWTEQGPSKMIATRLIALAKVATLTVKRLDLELNPKQLFTHSTKDYDFVIHLDAKAMRATRGESTDMVSEYIADLERAFGHTIVWFHSGRAQKIIAGLWNPIAESKRWKANLGYSTTPVRPRSTDDDDDMDLTPDISRNTRGTLNEIARLGGDLVSRITVKEDTL